MPISYNNKCIFIHIPKTGGITIESLLKIDRKIENYLYTIQELEFIYKGMSTTISHIPATLFKQLRPDIFDSYLKFSVVRNPYDKVISEYLWISRNDKKMHNLPLEHLVRRFSVWVENYYTEIDSWRKCPQYKFIYDDQMNLMVDHVLKFENFESDVRKLCGILNVEIKTMEHLNKSKIEIDRSLLLTKDVKKKIYSLFSEDFKIFGYKK
jgi:hypothetical protein